MLDGELSSLMFKRKFPEVLPDDVVYNMSQRDFVEYCRGHLWDKVALERYGKKFGELSFSEKLDVDLLALLKLAKAIEATKEE